MTWPATTVLLNELHTPSDRYSVLKCADEGYNNRVAVVGMMLCTHTKANERI